MARDELAKDDMRWQRMEEGWQMDECHHSIGHWVLSNEVQGAVRRFIRVLRDFRWGIRTWEEGVGKIRFWTILLTEKT